MTQESVTGDDETENAPSGESEAPAAATEGSAENGSAENGPAKPKPQPVFGAGAGLTLILPLAVFLVGLTLGGWLDSRALESELEPQRTLVENALARTDARGLSMGFGIADLAETLDKSPVKRSALEEAGAGVLGIDRAAEGTRPEVIELARTLEAYLVDLDAREDVRYPKTYTIVIGLTILAMLVGVRGYLKVPFRVSRDALWVGAAGIVVWVGLWWIDGALLGLGELAGAERQGYDPLTELADQGAWKWGFLAVRVTGLVLVVPIIEEFFLRGFLMRYVDAIRWDLRPLGAVTGMSAGTVAAYALMSHPGEPLAAVAWFSMVTWLYARTGNLWDCVVAHAVTNFLLGVFVLLTGTWVLW